MSSAQSRKIFDNETLKAIGDRIRSARGAITQEEFAESIGVSRSALTNYEAGRRLPNDVVLNRIAQVSGVLVPSLLFGSTVTPFEIYRRRVDDATMRAAQERPGFVPRFMISDDEIAFINLFRLTKIYGSDARIISDVVRCTKDFIENCKAHNGLGVQWGGAYLERLEAALVKGGLDAGYDPDYDFWITFWEEADAREE